MLTLAVRRSICRLLIGVIASTQLAIVAYACSGALGAGGFERSPEAIAAVAMADASASSASDAAVRQSGMGTGNECLDPALSNLCAAHCQYGQQSADHASTPAVPAVLLTSLYQLAPLTESTVSAGPSSGLQAPLAAADPPHAILHCCLRT